MLKFQHFQHLNFSKSTPTFVFKSGQKVGKMGKKVGFWPKATVVLQKIFSKKVGVTTFKVGKSGLKTAKIGYPNDEKSILDIH